MRSFGYALKTWAALKHSCSSSMQGRTQPGAGQQQAEQVGQQACSYLEKHGQNSQQ